ncbi:MAG: sigma-70 family RNA polymerase sigma factor, partial [Verrucomicrobiales bacterium]
AFAPLFLDAQKDVSRYVLSLVRDRDAVDDIMQDLAIALWRKFEEYDPDRPFLPWACRFAFYQVLKHRQRNQRHYRWIVRDEVDLEQFAAAAEDTWFLARREALERCMQTLPSEDRELLHCRYGSKETIQQMAKRTKTSVHKLYHGLDRIREDLMSSINATLRERGWEC